MDKEKFREHFICVTKYLIGFTKEYCYNNLADTYKFIVIPSSRTADKHLNEREIKILKIVNKFQDKLLTVEQVIDLLHQENRVPSWINIEIYEATSRLTVISLFCSRRFSDDNELNYKVDKYPPFHPLIPMPPDHLKIEKDGKFDVNWKKRLDDLKKPVSLFTKFKRLFSAS
ncbi:MAG: hypothetical protein ABIO56_11485 [Ferruginibacter sp.]